MAEKQGKIIQFVKSREPRKTDHEVGTSEKIDANAHSETLIQMPPKRRRSLHHWTFKGWTAPSPFLAEMMRSPTIAPPALPGTSILEAGALVYRRRKNGEVLILLVGKHRSSNSSGGELPHQRNFSVAPVAVPFIAFAGHAGARRLTS